MTNKILVDLNLSCNKIGQVSLYTDSYIVRFTTPFSCLLKVCEGHERPFYLMFT